MPQRVIEILHEKTNGDAIVTTDVGQHQMWAAQYYRFNKPNHMGYFWWIWNDGLWFTFGYWCAICKSGSNCFPFLETVVSK